MDEIRGDAKKVRELLAGTKYTIDYYQREYKWEEKQMQELVEDLTSRFLQDYEPGHERSAVSKYGHYFLGSIIISKKDSQNFIVDGQQRLTSLTLLLIYLNNLQKKRTSSVFIENMIFADHFGDRSFNMNVKEWTTCLEALYMEQPFDDIDQPESVQNLVQRYHDLASLLTDEIMGEPLLHFINWLTEKVYLVEITTYSDEDAYTIFETMNDRGLSLSPTDMLKGYLLAKITDTMKRGMLNSFWKEQIKELEETNKEESADFFKAWLRSQYAESIREHKKGAKQGDFDRIGTEFHRWVQDHQERIGLKDPTHFGHFIDRDLRFYTRNYQLLMKASKTLIPDLGHIFYNAQLGFTTQYQLLMAPLLPQDTESQIKQKLRLVALYLDILLNRRIWNWHNIGFSTMQYTMFLLMREIRHKSPLELADHLYQRLQGDKENFTNNQRFALNQRNYSFVQLILARITDYIERESGLPSNYLHYTTGTGKLKYEVEHIWANKPERYSNEFAQPADFLEYRNRIGGLLLLPKSFNASYGALTYEEKLPHYNAQNLLAHSLNSQCYEHNPGFLTFIAQSQLPFTSYTGFNRAAFDERQELYCQIAELLWNPEQLLTIVV